MNDILERIRKVFKDSGKSQTAFAKEIGVTSAYVWRMLNIDEISPSARTISDISREFRVSETWLLTGQGEPYIQEDRDQEFLRIQEEINLSDDDLIKRIIKAYWNLDETEKAAIRKLIDGFTQT